MMPETGLWIDLAGQGEPQGKDVFIALRADIDALEMAETNEALEYRSVRPGAAHMCGHDGHTASLAATIPLLLSKLK
jgi:metal-dependent amidase/aminoacylase/carboxypeptidase family protein